MTRHWFLLLFLLGSLSVKAQTWRTLFTSAQEAYEKGDAERMVALAKQCLDAYKKEDGSASENYASILRLVGNAYYATGGYEEGLVLINQEITLREGNKEVKYAGALENAALFHSALGNYDQAVEAIEKSRQVLELYYRTTDEPLVLNALALASNLYLNGQDARALDVFTKTLSALPPAIDPAELVSPRYYFSLLAIENGLVKPASENLEWLAAYYEQNDMKSEPGYQEVMLNLADVRVKQQREQEADQLLQNLQQWLEKNGGSGNEMYPRVLNSRAQLLQRMGRSQESSALFDKAGGSAEGVTAAIAINNKAALLQQAGQMKEAEAEYRKALTLVTGTTEKDLVAVAETKQNLAVLLAEEARVEEAIVLLDDALATLDKTQTGRGKIPGCLNKKAFVLTRAGKYNTALQTYRQSLSMLGSKKTAEWIVANNGLSVVYQQLGQVARADSVIQQLFTAYDGELREDITFASVLNNLAALRQVEGQLLTARDLLQQAAVITRRNAGTVNLSYATALENIAFVSLQLGELDAAKTVIDSVLLIREKILGTASEEYASGLINLGRYYQYAGEFSKAEPQFKRALTILEKSASGTQTEKIRATNGLATFYLTMGNYEEAEPLYNRSRRLIETQFEGRHAEYSTTLQNLATLYQLQDKFADAESLLLKSLEIDRSVFGQNHPQYAISLQNLATVYQKQSQFEKAQPLLEQVLVITGNTVGKDHPSYSITLSNLAALYQDTRQPEKAEKAWRESVELRRRILGENHPDYARSLYGLATIAYAKGQFDEAKKLYETVVQKYLEQIRENFSSLSEKEKGAFYAKIKPVFDTYQDFCIQYYSRNKSRPEAVVVLRELYDLQLSTKAILLNSTNKVRQRILTSGDATLISEFQKWIFLKEEIVRFYTLSEEERVATAVDITQLRQQANDLEKSLSSRSELFRSQFDQEIVTTAQVAGALKSDELAIEIIRLKRKFDRDSIYYAGLIVRPNNPNPELIVWPYGTRMETRFYRYHRNMIKFRMNDTLSYSYFWKPLKSVLGNARHLYVSCDGIFNKVNPNTLHDHKTDEWVVDNLSIGLVSNTNEVYTNAQSLSTPSTHACLFGAVDFNNQGLATAAAATGTTRSMARSYGFTDNAIPALPATEVEVDHIKELLGKNQWNTELFKVREASEENLKKLDNPRLIHIATHGYFMSDVDMDDRESDEAAFFNNPLLRSGILLAGAAQRRGSTNIETGEDGALSAYEAMNLYLDNTDLVVLSACETGLGEIRNGEGVYGLQRSFLVAGAKAVVMSLWQVDDVATQELMVDFYSRWLSTGNRQEAFRQAQLAMKEKYKDPYFWGAFVMIGN